MQLIAGDKHLMRPEVTIAAVTSTPVNFNGRAGGGLKHAEMYVKTG